MPQLDVHAVTSGGSLQPTLGDITTIALGGDGQSSAGVPIAPDALLIGWGSMTTIADTIARTRLLSQDQVDPINGEDYSFGALSLLGYVFNWTNLHFKTGARVISQAQVTAAVNNIGYYLDLYHHQGREAPVNASRHQAGRVVLSTTLGATVALTWGSTAFSPASAIPNGRYAILGAWMNAHTNYALLRFAHADFGPFKPGFPALDRINTAVGNAVDDKDDFVNHVGYQFVRISEVTGQPCVPVFRVSSAGTGLTIQILSITVDTPRVLLNLAYLGP